MGERLLIVVAGALLLVATLATLAPASTDSADCGWWFNAEWDRETSMELAEGYANLGDMASAFQVADNYKSCENKLDTRMWVSVGSSLAAVVVLPVGLWVRGGQRRREDDHDDEVD